MKDKFVKKKKLVFSLKHKTKTKIWLVIIMEREIK